MYCSALKQPIMVTLSNLSKSFNKGAVQAVRQVSLEVKKAELFGLIGADGAGKTTIFRILTTLLLPDEGSASVNGFDIRKDISSIRSCVGYMPGRFSLYQDLTVSENIQFFANLFGTSVQQNYSQIKEIYEQLEPFKDRRAGKLSGGMKQKLALCCALIHKPEILFLDEPTTGVDAVSRKEFWDMLDKLKEQGITIMVSTPYMDEATRCDTIALLQTGNLLSVNSPDKIIEQYPYKLVAIRSADIYKLLNDLRNYSNTRDCYAFGAYLHLSLVKDSPADLEQLINYLKKLHHTEIEYHPVTATIEDCFLSLLKN
jgi:ABC-2 type transport system ATP-binding protein